MLRFDWHSPADVARVRAEGPFDLLLGAGLAPDRWADRLWPLVEALVRDDQGHLMAAARVRRLTRRPPRYLQALHNAYEEFIEDISRVIPVIKVDWESFQNTDDVAASVREEYLKISAVRKIEFKPAPLRASPPPKAAGKGAPAAVVA